MACDGIDLSKLNKDEIVVEDNLVWVKAQVQDKIYFINGVANVVLEFSDGCFNRVCADQLPINQALLLFISSTSLAQNPELMSTSGGSGDQNDRGAICGIPVLDKFLEAQNAVDSNAVNQFGFHPAAIKPINCAIPVKSNIKIYGPFATANFGNCGGTNGESDPDLTPWAFGSSALMNAAGNAKANSLPTNFPSQIETGSITVAGLPEIGLGGSPANGPNLTGINVSFGSSGITTNYSFQTYTPKPGGFTRLFIDRLKNINKYRQEQLKFLRNNQIGVNKINRRLRIIRAIENNLNNRQVARADDATCQRVLVGEMYPFHPTYDGERTVVAMTSLPKAIQEMRYDIDKKAYMSLDGLYGPVSKAGDGGLPRYAGYSGLQQSEAPCHKASPVLPTPPFTKTDDIDNLDNYNLKISRIESDPLSTPGQNPHHEGETGGNTIDIVGRDSMDDGVITNFYMGNNEGGRYSEDYRFLALRGPLVLHAWGYDTQGKPIPNSNDVEDDAKAGTFKSTEQSDKFLKDWIQKPSTWPVAPVDLRFDRDRGVWVSPPPYKIVVAKLLEDLPEYGSAKGALINKNNAQQEFGRPIFDADGVEVQATEAQSDAKIKLVDRIGESYTKDSLVYAYYDTTKCEYIILSGNPSSQQIVRFKLIDPCSVTEPPFDDDWLKHAGYGDKFFDNPDIRDSYAVRLNCNKQPIDKDGNILEDINFNTIKPHLIIVRDVVGKFGPAFSKYQGFDQWMERAAEGYAVKIIDPQPSGSSGEENLCLDFLPCVVTYVDEENNVKNIEDKYDLLYLESYARFIHGCLTQDLYTTTEQATTKYAGDFWKTTYPSGNATIEIDKYYGNVDNGKEPYYLDNNGEELDVRVFDPWVSSKGEPISCYDPKSYQLYTAKSGTPVVAAFNETLKRYEIIEVAQKPAKAVRFKLYGCKTSEASSPDWGADQDAWTEYAGFFDKIPNDHILGIRINCDGEPVDRNGTIITEVDINDPLKKDQIFIRLYDTAGKFGPSFAGYKNFNHWKTYASEGFAVGCDVAPSGNCVLGGQIDCGEMDEAFDAYDIIYLESYARYIHGCLTQDLYATQEQALTTYSDDSFKSAHPSGNAAINVFKYYGGADNEQEPKFWDNNIEEIPIRVFDPWVKSDGTPEDCYNPETGQFYDVKSGTPVVAVLNEKKKRYEIIEVLQKPQTVVRFKIFEKCSTNLPPSNADDADAWTNFAGYKDKFYNNHCIGIRINCDGAPIDVDGNLIGELDLTNPNKANKIFINLYDTSGKWGPAYGFYNGLGDFENWSFKAATGFAAVANPSPKNCLGLAKNGQCSSVNDEYPSFDIIFVEGYARFIHGCLKQDLYVPDTSDLSEYSGDSYKLSYPQGNAAIESGIIYYGDSANGMEPLFFDAGGNELPIRVFDPWLDEVECYNPTKSKFYGAKKGTAFTAIFNEKKKKYYLWSIDSVPERSIRFKLFDYCQSALPASTDPFAAGDNWMNYAGYGDKHTNAHAIGIRINCDGLPINDQEELINSEIISQALLDIDGPLARSIFVNLYDTPGRWGPSDNLYTNFSNWIQNAANGFGIRCVAIPSGETCSLGRHNSCLSINPNYPSYDIAFLESYARFIEANLAEDLYPTQEKLSTYSDQFKLANPNGNAKAIIVDNKFYGDSVNGREPKFRNSSGQNIDLRVFDPFMDTDPSKNPFRGLKEGDRVLCVFNDKLKKYTIYSALNDLANEVVKFALVADKGSADEYVQAILVNAENMPITIDQKSVIENQQDFLNNLIIVRDPFPPGGNLKSRFGPALGSATLNEHINGMNFADDYGNEPVFPFIGFALKRSDTSDYGGTPVTTYDIIALEHYATLIRGKIASITPVDGLYLGARLYHTDGVVPICRGTAAMGTPNIHLEYDMLNFNGVHSYIVGDIAEQASGSDLDDQIDGCRFLATLDPALSSADKLVYRIVEAEHLALNGKTLIKDDEIANDINSDKENKGATQGLDTDKVESVYSNGFMWDKIKSPTKYENVRIRTKCGWPGQAKITVGSCLETIISGLEENGSPLYQTISATTMAQVGEKTSLATASKPGLFGTSAGPSIDKEIRTTDYFYEGVGPNLIEDQNKRPKFDIGGSQQWMTHQSSKVVGIYDETTTANISEAKYRIIYADQAPTLIRCTAIAEFTPLQFAGILLVPNNASDQGVNSLPIPTLLLNAKNPMGYGAKIGDFVTVMRVFTGGVVNDANYEYMVIGTSFPPGALK